MAMTSGKTVFRETAQAMWKRGKGLSKIDLSFSRIDVVKPPADSGRRSKALPRAKVLRKNNSSRICAEIIEEFLSEIRRGEIVAVGYHKCVKLNVRPTIIPTRFIQASYFDFENDIVSAYEHTFQFVRVCYPAIRTKLDRGRPAIGRFIVLAMRLANFEWDTPFREKPHKKHYDVIRKRIKKMAGERIVPTDRTIAKYYAEGLEAIEEMMRRRKSE